MGQNKSKNSESLANLKKRFLHAVSGSVALKIYANLAKLAGTAWLAKILGAEGFGLFAYALSLIMISAIPFHKGLPSLITRNLAVYLNANNWGAIRGLLIRGTQLVFTLSITILIIAATISMFIDTSKTALHTFLIALAILPCMALSGVRRGALIGLHRPVLAQIPEFIIQPTLFLALIAGCLLFLDKADFTPMLAMILRVVTVVLELVVGYILLFKYLPNQINKSPATFETSGWFRGAVAFMLIGGMTTINTEIGILMLGMFSNIEDVGVYKVVSVLALLVVFVMQGFNTALLPNIAKLHANGDKVQLQKIVTLSCRLVVLCGLPIATLLIFFGDQCLHFIFGEEFSRGAPALTVLVIGMLLHAATGPVGLLLNMSGYELDTIKGRVVGTAINTLLCIILIPKLGIMGAAWAATCSMVTWNILLLILVQRRLGLHATVFGKINLSQNTNNG